MFLMAFDGVLLLPFYVFFFFFFFVFFLFYFILFTFFRVICFASLCPFYTPPYVSGEVLCFHVGRPCVCPSVRRLENVCRPSALRVRSITEILINGFLSNNVSLGIEMG